MPNIRAPKPILLQALKYREPKDFTDLIYNVQSQPGMLATGLQTGLQVGREQLEKKMAKDKKVNEFKTLALKSGVPQDIVDTVIQAGDEEAGSELLKKNVLAEQFKTPQQRIIDSAELEKIKSETFKNLNPAVTNVVVPGYQTPSGAPGVIPSRGNPVVTPLEGMTPKPPVPTPPQGGYEFTPEGTLRTIPGGPAATQAEEVKVKEQAAADAQKQEAELVISKIDSALKNVSNLSAGYGASTKNIPGSPAMNLSADLDTIISSLGLNKLMEMKANSKAGASGMGTLSDREMTLLTSAIASLKQSQTPKQLKAKLNEVKDHYQNILKMNEGINPFKNGSKPQQLLIPAQPKASPYSGLSDAEIDAKIKALQGKQ